MSQGASDFFKENNFVVISNVLDHQALALLRSYTISSVRRADYLQTYHPDKFHGKLEGLFGDGQVNGAYYRYGDPMFDSLMVLIKGQVEEFTGLSLLENYTYWRMYETGNDLERHIDRYSCEISATMCIGHDSSNLENPSDVWPIWVKDHNEIEIPIKLNPGDVLIYKGCEIEHWREEFKGLNQSQVFLHYNVDNQSSLIYDGRPILGIPKGW